MKREIKTTPPRWRRWFAWYPVTVGRYRVWLEWIERKREWHGAHDGYYPFDSYRLVSEWPYCCEQMRGEMWIEGKLQEEWCPVHSSNGEQTASNRVGR